MATKTKKTGTENVNPPAQDTKDPLTDIIAAAIRAGFNDRAALAQDLLDQSQAKVAEYTESLEKMTGAGVNGAMLQTAKDMLAAENDLLIKRQERIAVLADTDEIARRIESGVSFIRSLADPDATAKTARTRGGSTGPRTPKVPFRAWVGGKEITAKSALESFSLLAFYKVKDPKGTYHVENLYKEFRDQAGVDLENNATPGTYEATCNNKKVKIEVLVPETATA